MGCVVRQVLVVISSLLTPIELHTKPPNEDTDITILDINEVVMGNSGSKLEVDCHKSKIHAKSLIK